MPKPTGWVAAKYFMDCFRETVFDGELIIKHLIQPTISSTRDTKIRVF